MPARTPALLPPRSSKSKPIAADAVDSMASWNENQEHKGVASFFYDHLDEERQHTLKLVKYVNERGGKAYVKALDKQQTTSRV